MNNISEKTIAIQTDLSIDLLGKLVMIQKSNPNMSISEFLINWKKSKNLESNYSIVNQGVILTHLYGLILYPKVIFHKQIPHIKLNSSIIKNWGDFQFEQLPIRLSQNDKQDFQVEVVANYTDLTLEFLIRKIRNALGHARVDITENMDFAFFSDEDGTKIKFSISGLQIFCDKFMNAYLKQNWEQNDH